MVSNKSLDESKIIAALLRDVQTLTGDAFTTRALTLTSKKLMSRYAQEGIGFLTKTLPKMGKELDRALCSEDPFDTTNVLCKKLANSQLPKLFGELYERIFDHQGRPLVFPDANCVAVLRQLLYCFYKYELPYTEKQEQKVLSQFEETEKDLAQVNTRLQAISSLVVKSYPRRRRDSHITEVEVARVAKDLLARVFLWFDPKDIYPKHGPGVVATKQSPWEKYNWTNVSSCITDYYPFDEYFCSSPGHVCDCYREFSQITSESLPARVILVPKDSRGPRLISAEPVDNQWVQQGLGKAIVEHVEKHELTRDSVHFTDQTPNQFGALLGSSAGRYATLDLKEASDRISLDLVRLLFPEPLLSALLACRSSSTVLPDGRQVPMMKYAPMGSSLCFPVLALTIWALLSAGTRDAGIRSRILVYGDDVIVPTEYSENAITILETFGLRVNRDKCCTKGFFRESCGVDAFKGQYVTPVRIRTVWKSSRSPHVYTSWIAYANSFWDKQYYNTYWLIVNELVRIYGPIPCDDMHLACPSLRCTPHDMGKIRTRVNTNLQKVEYNVWDVESTRVKKILPGWQMLLRYFAESGAARLSSKHGASNSLRHYDSDRCPFRVSSYTPRNTSRLVRRWR